MSRIVLATFGSLGDLHPALALAFELRRRGHAVTIASSGLYRETISTLDFAFAELRPELSVLDPELVRRIMDGTRGLKYLIRGLMLPAVREMFSDLQRATAGADLLVTNELVYAAPTLAEHTGLRWISYSLAPMSYLSLCDPCVPPLPLAGEWVRRIPRALVRASTQLAELRTRPWWRPVRELRRELGLAPGRNPIFTGKHSPQLDLALFSPTLQPPQPDWPVSTRQLGFCFYDEIPTTPNRSAGALPPAVENFLATGEPPIVFTLGSAAVFAANNFYAESARAAQLLGRRALLLLGKNSPPPILPPSILTWDYLPYAGIFPRAAAVVHQGGVGTTAQALRAGRPMLVVPFGFDQPDNAARIARLGVGRSLPRARYRSERVARELAALLATPGIIARAEAIGTRIRTERGTAAACDALEAQLH